MVLFFDEKLALFGADKLTHDITLADLSEADMEALNAGAEQLLPQRDRIGRLVVGLMCVATESFRSMVNRVSFLRGDRNRNFTLAQDKEAQRSYSFVICPYCNFSLSLNIILMP